MTAALHLVGQIEADRARTLELMERRYRPGASARTMRSSLRAIARAATGAPADAFVDVNTFPWELLAHLGFFCFTRDRVFDRYGRVHARKHLAAMHSVLRACIVTRLATAADVASTLEAARVRTDGTGPPPPLHIDADDIAALLRTCRHDPNPLRGHRDLALVSVTASTGARRAEIVAVDYQDLEPGHRSVRLNVKGGGARDAAIHPATVEHLETWLDHRGRTPGPLFNALRRGGHIQDRAISAHQFWKLLRDRSIQAGIDPVIAPHDLRRWLVTELLDRGTDIFTAARIVGHARVETTFRYDRRAVDRLRDVVDRLPLPGIPELDDVSEA